MSERDKQVAFLKALIRCESVPENRELQERIAHAERNERSVRRACWLVALLGMISVAGLGYSAVLLPEFFENQGHIIIKLLCALGLGSGICLVVFWGLWLRYRAAVNRLHDEGRRVIIAGAESRHPGTGSAAGALVAQQETWAVYQMKTSLPRTDTEIVQARRAAS